MTDARHLLFVTVPFGVQGDSVVAVVDHLCGEHRAAGGEASVVVSDNRDVRLANADAIRVDYTRYALHPRWHAWQTRVDMAAGLAGLTRPFYGRLYLPAVEAAAAARPDVVILCESHYGAVSLPHFRRALPDTPLFLYAHVNFSRSYRRPELNRLLGLTDGVIVVSQAMADRLTGRLGPRSATSVHVVRNGVDTRRFHPGTGAEPGRHDVLYAGRVVPSKGVHHLLEAYARASQRTSAPGRLRIVGSAAFHDGGSLSDYEVSLRSRATQLGVPVDFIPFVSREALAGLYRSAAVVCVPSVYPDPFPLVVYEAMASGRPVIASRAGGLVESGGDVAVFVDPEDTESFAGELARLLDDPPLRADLGRRARQRAEENSWSVAYQAMLAVLSG